MIYINGQLQNNYYKCFILKEKPLKDYPHEFKPHMYELHKIYLDDLRERGESVNKNVVIDYVNLLPPPRLMYSVNYKFNELVVDEQKMKLLNEIN